MIERPTINLQRSARLKNGKDVAALAGALTDWFRDNARDLPWRKTRDPYAIWVSEIMLQQTQVKTVIPYWERWMKALPDISALAKTSPEKIHKLWEGLGYYTRVRNMQKTAQKIVAEHGGVFPREYENVVELAGIGRYTAGAICSIAYNQPAPILDGNVTRVLARLFGIQEMVREKATQVRLWSLAETLVQAASPDNCSNLNQALMELGALICIPRNPRCDECPVRKRCVAYRNNLTDRIPALPTRPRITARRFVVLVPQQNGSLFVRQRPAGVVNAHLWEFPNIEIFRENNDLQLTADSALGIKRAILKPICRIRHSITRYAISLDVYGVAVSRQNLKADGEWIKRKRLDQLPFCAAHKRILQCLGRDPEGEHSCRIGQVKSTSSVSSGISF